jgi:hypothetical protein
MKNDAMSVAAVLFAGIAAKRFNDSVAIASADIETAERRLWMAQALRSDDAVLLAPRIYAVRSPAAVLAMLNSGVKQHVMPPPPHETALALCRQHNWRLSFPLVFACFLLGLAERPMELPEIPYDGTTKRHYPKAKLTLVPAAPSLFNLSAAGQALTIGVPREISEQKLVDIGVQAARGPLGLPNIIEGLKRDLDGRLGERERIVATSIVNAARDNGLILRAPPDWAPPPDISNVVRVEDWWIRQIEDGLGEYHCLAARTMTGHPVLGDTNLAHSSPLIWLDERAGYARTVSRLYHLGRRSRDHDGWHL